MNVRERLDDECKDCGKSKADAEEIAPVSRGRFSLGPDWACGECMEQIVTDGGTVEDGSDRRHPPEASILATAQEDSHRHYFVHGDAVFSTPAPDVELALEFALDEFPNSDRSDFELITDFCEHGTPRHENAWGCYRCRVEREQRRRDGLNWLFAEVPR